MIKILNFLRKKNKKNVNFLEKELIIDERIIKDLVDFTGLNKEYILKHLNRENNCTYSWEYNIRNPKNDSELEWFYITSEKYLFANIIHNNWELIDMIHGPKILDYGGGAGVDTFYLAKKGLCVHYFDISIIQREFVRFMKNKYSINNVKVIEPFFESKFDTINCIKKTYDSILVRSLLEHIPYYEKLIKHLILKLNSGGTLYEASKFGPSNKDPMHIHETQPLEKIIKDAGLELIYNKGVHKCWKKIN